jgi:hypothetical protein
MNRRINSPVRPRESGDPVSFVRCLDLGLPRHFAKGLGSRLRGNERRHQIIADEVIE